MKGRALLLSLLALALALPGCSLVKPEERLETAGAPAAERPRAVNNPPPISTTLGAGTRHTYSSCEISGPYLALTFDDGPHPSNTPRLLAMLKERNVKSTFFLIGTSVNAYPEITRQIIADGHEIANHTQTHALLSKLSDAGVARELGSANSAIANAVDGYKAQLFRPPYGAITARQKQSVHSNYGFPSIMWSVDPLDWKYRNSARVAQQLIAGAQPGAIMLCHDIHATTVAAIPQVLDTLLARGFQFVTVTQLINMELTAAKPSPSLAVLQFSAGSL